LGNGVTNVADLFTVNYANFEDKDGISAHTNLDSNQVARRLNEMKMMGLIELTGNTVKSNSGRSEREWQCTQSN
jgi:hypothetical protein